MVEVMVVEATAAVAAVAVASSCSLALPSDFRHPIVVPPPPQMQNASMLNTNAAGRLHN